LRDSARDDARRPSFLRDETFVGTDLKLDYILGMAKMGGGVKILLDIDRVLYAADTPDLQRLAA
jgi:purine-binding chemotaxis protein CheW